MKSRSMLELGSPCAHAARIACALLVASLCSRAAAQAPTGDDAAPAPPPEEREPILFGASAVIERPGPSETSPYGTGSKLGVPLEEIPATVNVITASTLRERGVNNLDEALTLVPGVTPTWTYGGFLHLELRGLQAITLFDGYRDSRAIFANSAPQQGLFDLERIEVLRGPSSVLYGYGAVGGVVNLIRKSPSREAAAELELGFGLPDQLLIHAGAQGPAGELFSYRVDIGRVERTDFRGASTERNLLSTAVRFAPGRRHTFDLRLSYALDHYNTDVGIPTIEDLEAPGRWGLPPDARYANRYGTANDHLDYKRFDTSLAYRFDLTDATYLRAYAGIARDDYEYLAAESLTYVPPEDMLPATVDRGYLMFIRGWQPVIGQLELHSEQFTGPVQHRLAIGYELNHFGGESDRGNTGGAVPGPIDFVYPVDRAEALAFQRTAIDHYRYLTHSVYGFDHIRLIESLIVTGGLRFDTVRSRTRREFLDPFSGEEIAEPSTGERRDALYSHREALTGQAGAVFTPVDPLTLYAGYANSFKPLFVSPSNTEANEWDPERGDQVEAGVRARVEQGQHRLDFDGAAYYIEKRNILVPRGTDDFTQAGKVRSQGVDLLLGYQAPFLVELSAGYSFNDAEFRRFVQPDPVSGENTSLKGNQLPFAPRHTATAWLRLRFTPQVGAGFGGRFLAGAHADAENRLPLPDYALFDASAWYTAGNASFILSVRNVFDTHDYFLSAINTWAENPQVTPGPGRELLGTLRLEL